MNLSPVVAFLAAASACAPGLAEQRGDAARRAGNKEEAARIYEAAMSRRPIMDFEYERLRDKRLAMFGPRVDSTPLRVAGPPLTQLRELLDQRRGLRDRHAPAAQGARIEKAVLAASQPTVLAARDATEVGARVSELLALLVHAQKTGAPSATLDGIKLAIDKSLELGLPPLGAQDGTAHLTTILDLRDALRAHGLPTTRLDPEYTKLPLTPTATTLSFASASALRLRTLAHQAPLIAVSFIDRLQEVASAPLMTNLATLAASHQYLDAIRIATEAAAFVPAGRPLHARIDTLATEATAYHLAEAQPLPPGFRRLFRYGLARGFAPADLPERVAEAKALESRWNPVIDFAPTLRATSDCAALYASATRVIAKRGGRAIAVTVELSCRASEVSGDEGRTFAYTAEEKVRTKEPQTKKVQKYGKIGEESYACSETTSMGTVLVGTCYRDKMGTYYVDETVFVDVEKIQDVNGSQPFTARVRDAQVAATGTATLIWDDGFAIKVPLAIEVKDHAESWSFDYPGRKLGESRRREDKPPTPSALGAMRSSAGTDVGIQVEQRLRAGIAAHRAQLARDEGTTAQGRGDDAAAGEAFIRSALIEKSEGPAAVWIAKAYGVDADVTREVLRGNRLFGPPSPAALPKVDEPAPEITIGTGDGYDSEVAALEQSSEVATTATYHDRIVAPYEIVIAHLGVAPFNLHTAMGTRTAVALSMQGSFALLELFAHGMRYGVGLHDEGGFRLFGGMQFADQTYSNGEDEGPIAWGWGAFYNLYAALRTHHVGLFAGANVGYQRFTAGDTTSKGRSLTPAARITLRVVGVRNLTVEAAGFVTTIDGWARTDRLRLGIPLSTTHAVDLLLTYERTELSTRSLDEDGMTTLDLGAQPVTIYGVQIGARL